MHVKRWLEIAVHMDVLPMLKQTYALADVRRQAESCASVINGGVAACEADSGFAVAVESICRHKLQGSQCMA